MEEGLDGVVKALIRSSMIAADSEESGLTCGLHVRRPRKCLPLIPRFVGNGRIIVVGVVRLQLISVSGDCNKRKESGKDGTSCEYYPCELGRVLPCYGIREE